MPGLFISTCVFNENRSFSTVIYVVRTIIGPTNLIVGLYATTAKASHLHVIIPAQLLFI